MAGEVIKTIERILGRIYYTPKLHAFDFDSISIFWQLAFFLEKNFCRNSPALIFALPKREREFSSAGSEHLPYKQRVGGSNPSTPTQSDKGLRKLRLFFLSIRD